MRGSIYGGRVKPREKREDIRGFRYNTFDDPHELGPDQKTECVPVVEGNRARHASFKEPLAICSSVLDVIGNTPIVRLNRIPQEEGVRCEVLVKCEYLNPGGSSKDRVALRLIEEAERDGVLKPGYSTIVEPSSGNMGIGLALAAAVKGYKCIVVMPEKMSTEKADLIAGLGARVIRSSSDAPFNDPRSHFQTALRLCRDIPGAVMLGQHRNPHNPATHYDWTAREIYAQCSGQLDMFVSSADTGGTLSGVGRLLKEEIPSCIVVGVDHVCSVLAEGDADLRDSGTPFYEVEGVGDDFVPAVLDPQVIDHWERCSDDEAFPMARRLIRSEGLLCGSSSGLALAGALRAAKKLRPDQRCLVILPDAARNYLTKFISNEWMVQRDMMSRIFHEPASLPHWYGTSLSAIPLQPPIVLPGEATFADAFAALAANPGMFFVLINDRRYKGSFGSVSSRDVLKAMTSPEGLNVTVDTPPRLPILSAANGATLGMLHDVLINGRAPACVVVDDMAVPIACVDANGLLAFLQSLRNQSRREKACRRPTVFPLRQEMYF